MKLSFDLWCCTKTILKNYKIFTQMHHSQKRLRPVVQIHHLNFELWNTDVKEIVATCTTQKWWQQNPHQRCTTTRRTTSFNNKKDLLTWIFPFPSWEFDAASLTAASAAAASCFASSPMLFCAESDVFFEASELFSDNDFFGASPSLTIQSLKRC